MPNPFRNRLLASTLIGSAALLGVGEVQAQVAAPTPTAAAAPPEETIVVTGTLFRRKDTETASPVTVVTAEELEKRGIQTVQAGIQLLSSINGPALTNSFSSNGAFASGASAASLRGLSSNSTLTLFDGLRATYYPLADDGSRNFVDLNTIPDEIVESFQVLKDGASSEYEADAVAGVINIITKKQVVGLLGSAEAGISERGDAANHRLSLTFGRGDLHSDGYNFYISGHYVDSDALYNNQRRYPFNSSDLQGICYNGVCGPNNTSNGVTNGVYNGLSTAPDVFIVRPYNAANTGAALGRYQLLNPAAGCGQNATSYTLSDADYANNRAAPRTVCQQDLVRDTGEIEPRLYRWGLSGRFTKEIGSRAQAYVEANYERSSSSSTGTFGQIRANAPAGINFPAYSTSANIPGYDTALLPTTVLTLPIYVCPRGTAVACTAANGTLNPNNPFAAQGEVARIAGRVSNLLERSSTLNETYRIATGIEGGFGDGWGYQVNGVAMESLLETRNSGYVFIQHLLDVVNDGSFNFVNPQANSKAVLDYLAPVQVNHNNSHLYQGEAILKKSFFHLPGGPVQVAIGGTVRYEDLYNPSGNPDYNGPTQRYFVLNAFGAAGHRNVEAGFFEVSAPVFKQLELGVSGRYDTYSTGQSHFSPKFTAKFTPIRQISLRGTYAEGFRIPNFAESGALPTTGYVTVQTTQLPQAFVNQHLNAQGKPDAYLQGITIGETTVGTAGLKPEKSRSFTVGTILKPHRDLTFTVDYYNIKKTDAITSVNFQSAIDAYYATGALKTGPVTIIPDQVDVDHPNAQPLAGFAQGGFINANTIETSGIDFGMTLEHRFRENVRFTSHGEATWILKLNTSFPDGHTEHYVGTLGNFNLTAGSGTPEWKASWQNTLDIGLVSLTATAYYTSGYNYSAEDQGSVAGDCSLVPTNLDGLAYQPCNVKAFVDVDMHAEFRPTKTATLYLDVLNIAGVRPPFDGTTYGAYLYNPVVGDQGIIGRSFRAGARFKF